MENTDLFSRVKLYIVDDELLICESLSYLIDTVEGYKSLGFATDGNTALKEIALKKPDVVIMDVKLKEENGIDLTEIITRRMPGLKVLILSSYCNTSLLSMAINAGASGYTTKDIRLNSLQESIENIIKSETFYIHEHYCHLFESIKMNYDYNPMSALTQREMEIMNNIVKEFTTREIATRLGISEKTVRNHKSNIMQKLNLKSDASLIKLAYYMALI